MRTKALPTHGIRKRTVLDDNIDARVEELEINGYTVVESGFSRTKLHDLRTRLDGLYDAQLTSDGLEESVEADIVRCPLAADERFIDVACAPVLIALCRRVFGSYFVLLQQNGVINRPKAREYQTRWHRDLSYQHFVTSRTIALNALFCLDDFSAETGGTNVLPGTHRVEVFPSDFFVAAHQITLEAKAGSILVLDALLFHCAGYNRSPKVRRGVNHLIGLPILAQQIDIPRLLTKDLSDDSFLNVYLGYRWNPAESISTWRKSRMRKK